jgi:hypothetical protein
MSMGWVYVEIKEGMINTISHAARAFQGHWKHAILPEHIHKKGNVPGESE